MLKGKEKSRKVGVGQVGCSPMNHHMSSDENPRLEKGIYIWDEINATQLYRDYLISHEIKIPYQPVFHGSCQPRVLLTLLTWSSLGVFWI